MSGIQVEASFDGFGRVSARLQRLSPVNRTLILDRLGQVVEMQVKKRIQFEKTAPDGTAWKPNREGTSTLLREGHLRDSIHHVVISTEAVRTGSNLIYARIHNEGGTILPKKGRYLVFEAGGEMVFATKVVIPKRQYLGFSADNKRQIERTLVTLMGAELGA